MNTQHTIHDPRGLISSQKLRYYTPVAMLFVSIFLTVNIVTQKIVPIGSGGILLTAGDFVYPLSYALSVVLTEVYGYAMSRRVIWAAFICGIFMSAIISFSVALPCAEVWGKQEQFRMVLGNIPRLLAASFGAFLIGEFMGTYLLAKVKVLTAGKHLWLRSLGATLFGQGIDSIIFTSMAFVGVMDWHNIFILSVSAYICKAICQILLTPGVYVLTRFLKKHEHVDIFDRNTNFNPFHLGLK